MRKVFTLIVVLVLSMSYSKGQVRFTEVQPNNPPNNSSITKYFELFYKTSSLTNDNSLSLDGYVIVVYFKSNSSESIRVAQFNPITPFGDEAVYNDPQISSTNGTVLFTKTNFLAYSTGSGGNAVKTYYPNQELWSTAFVAGSIKEYPIVNLTATQKGYSTPNAVSDIFDDNIGSQNSFAMFLFKSNKLIDFVSNTSASIEINKIPGITVGGQSINFSSIIVSGEKVGPELGSFNNTYEIVNTTTNSCGYGWDKVTANNSPLYFKSVNQVNFPTWENHFYFWTTTASRTSSPHTSADYYKLTSAIGAVSKNGSYGANSIDFFMQLVNPTNFNTENPATELSIKVWKDVNNSGSFDAGVDQYITGFSPADNKFVSQLTSSTIWLDVDPTSGVIEAEFPAFTISIPRSEIQIDAAGNFYRFFIMVNNASSTCFNVSQPIELAAALPVNLKNISLLNCENKNKYFWTTSSESNNKGFEVQRSIGSTNDFKTIGFVGTRAKDGNSQTELSYSFEDADVKAGQTHYYRLNQIDFDGKSAFSPVKSIKPGSIESNLNVYPNPSQGSFTLTTGSNSGKLNIFVMDNTGRVVNQFMNVSTSNTRINNLKKGFYTLKIVNTESGEQSAQRVVVQ